MRATLLERLDRLLSSGHSDALPERLARHVRVTNALALVGLVLSLVTVPVDVIGGPWTVVVIDFVAAFAFGGAWVLNARGRYTAARVLFMTVTNGVMFGGVLGIGALPELRTVFFPLALIPFLVFSVTERGWLAVFIALPIAGYFTTELLPRPPPSVALSVNIVYAPALSFLLIVTGSYVFAVIERTAEEKLLRARTRAAHGARLAALGEMSSGIAHEIRNPLTAIHLAASQLVEKPDDPAQVRALGERIGRIVMRASRIIETLRSFARDAGGDPFVTVPVQRIVDETLELSGKRLTDHGVTLTVSELPADLVVECRPVQLSQELMNLLGNAYDAVGTTGERWVRVDVAATETELELAVTDSGPGIPELARARIFEPFFTTKAADRGTGLGLSLARGLVEAHGGTLELDPTSPHTRFVARVPRVQRRRS